MPSACRNLLCGLGSAVLAHAAFTAMPDGVSAATVAVVVERVDIGEGAVEDDQRLVFRARRGERNRVRLTFAGRSVTITDSAGVEPMRGCERLSGVATTARCDLRAGHARAVVSLGDRNDVVRLAGFVSGGRLPVGGQFQAGGGDDIVIGGDGYGGGPIGGSQELSGGPGDDLLVGGRQSGNFRGGPGRDRMLGGPDADYFFEDKRKNGSDTIIGGRPKILRAPWASGDEVRYSERRRDVIADLNDRRDDGERGERDRLVGVENIQGGRGSDRLSGDRDKNLLSGGGGADYLAGGRGADLLRGDAGLDELVGGPGADFIDAGSGDDSVLADDGSQDEIECGFGADRVSLDGLDFFRNQETYVDERYLDERDQACEQVSRSSPVGLLFLGGIELTHLRSGAVDTYYEVGCPGDALHCDGTLTLLRNEQPLFTDRVSLDTSTRESFVGSVPKDRAASFPRTGFRGTVLVSFVDPFGTTIERRSVANVRVD